MLNTASKDSGSPPLPLAFTPGDPAGIGLDLCISLAQNPPDQAYIVVADPKLIQARAELLNTTITLHEWQPGNTIENKPGIVHIYPVICGTTIRPGEPNHATGQYILHTLKLAVDLCREGQCSALVTGPINKAVVASANPGFTGHTEWLAQYCEAPLPVMMLATETLRVALVTTHLPLKAVSPAIKQDLVFQTGKIVYESLQQLWGLRTPQIFMAGLNPHAGEEGLLGDEEILEITPALQQLSAAGYPIQGPYPGDTLFTPDKIEVADAFIAMYHDQGLAVVKHAGFGQVVNLTLGLPIIRTSVDHGTAYSLAGTGEASDSSLRTAMRWANRLAGARPA